MVDYPSCVTAVSGKDCEKSPVKETRLLRRVPKDLLLLIQHLNGPETELLLTRFFLSLLRT